MPPLPIVFAESKNVLRQVLRNSSKASFCVTLPKKKKSKKKKRAKKKKWPFAVSVLLFLAKAAKWPEVHLIG